MNVVKRNGEKQPVDFNKVTDRYKNLLPTVDPIPVAQKVCSALYDGISTTELDCLAAETAISMSTLEPKYGELASRIVVSDLQKETRHLTFSDKTHMFYMHKFVTEEFSNIVKKHVDTIHKTIDYSRDYLFDYFGMKTLQKSYLLKIGNKIIERPQDMWMRVSIGIHGDDIESIVETYEFMSRLMFTHATPTLFNAGSPRPQMSSCFLLDMSDSLDDIYRVLSQCAQISKWAGGIGLNIHDLRSTGSSIREMEGACTGIVPMLRNFNATARYVNQGGKRPGSIAVYLSVDHPDIPVFLDLKKNTGDEEARCRDLFYAVWIPDIFMKRVKENKEWSFFDPHECPGLSDAYGEKYEKLYLEYESQGKARSKSNAQKIWFDILQSQIETGTPYMLYKDAVNEKSNQKNVGTIKSSNLCTEILEYTSRDEVAVCNLASIALPMFLKEWGFDYEGLHHVTKVITKNLNKVIDRNYYPVPEAERSNKRHRPIGIGVQGLADLYILMKYQFDSSEAAKLNKDVFETIYHASVEASMELAKKDEPYETFAGSPMSLGLFQFDLWNVNPSDRYDWDKLRQEVISNGLRNSLLLAPMPTASTSQILGNNECIEPYTSNLYLRRTMAGEFPVVNKHLVKDLQELKLWDKKMKDLIIFHEGSVQNIGIIPENIKNLYKTAWELSQKVLIDQAADRGAFICQSQSLNLFVAHPTKQTLSSMHFHAWNRGLKTGMYYLRTKAAANPIQFTIAPTAPATTTECESCSA